MSQKNTKEIIKLLSSIPKEYSLDVDFKDISWDNREFCQDIVLRNDYSKFVKLQSICEWEQVFYLYQSISDERCAQAIDYVVKNFDSFELKQEIKQLLFKVMNYVPIISCLIIEALSDSQSNIYPIENHMYIALVHAVIQAANYGKELVAVLLQNFIRLLVRQSVKFSISDITKMVKSIVYCVRHTNVASGLLNVLFSDESNIFELTDEGGDQAICFSYLKKFTLALAIDYIGEAGDKCPCDNYGIPQGAEDSEDDYSEIKKRSEKKKMLSDFLPKKMGQTNTEFYGSKPVPVMKCVEVLPPDKNGFHKINLRTDVSNKIRNGDHLRFSASRRSTDAPNNRISVFDAITDSVQNGILSFKLKQTEPRELFNATWNVYICASTTTFNAMLSAIKILITLKTESTVVFKSILGLPQEPKTFEPFELKQATIPPLKFNENQERAIQEALNNPLTLVWGPPGSGKTTVIVEILLQFLLHRKDLRILVSASTHNAVDNVLSRFLSERKSRFEDGESSDVIRIASDMVKVSEKMKKWTLDAFVGANIYKSNKAMKAAESRLDNSSIVFSTCSAAGVGLLRGKVGVDGDDETKNKKKHEQKFDVVIVDEASQITEPNALIPIVKNSKFVILVGDHLQLRPTVSEIAKECGLETSLFEKLYTSKVEDPTCKKIMLNVQFRMHEKLATFPSTTFYEGKLITGVKDEDRIIPDSHFPWPVLEDGMKFPAVFVNCSDFENHFVGSTSKMNAGQCQVSHKIIKALREGESNKTLTITVLSPYTKQVSELRQKLVGNKVKVDVETVDSFQGRESDIIIYSSVVANASNRLGFLDDARRMNVAITRAKYGLIVIGHRRTLMSNKLWKDCIEYCKEVNLP